VAYRVTGRPWTATNSSNYPTNERESKNMDTMQETNLVTNTLTANAIAVIELLEGAITHADKGKSALHALNSVQLLGGAGGLIARATDRYRLIEGKVEGEGHLDHTLIALDDVKRLIELVKGNKLSLVSFNRIGDLLTIGITGSSLTLNVLSANFPNTFADLFNKASESVATDKANFNPAYFADYAKIAGKGNAVSITFTGENKPMAIGVKGNKVEWNALLMPMRII
jgi:DNA polymerase III sliding clamp (beta) subunit (PCNA family)